MGTSKFYMFSQFYVNKLMANKFKPFVYADSSAAFLTKDYASYKAAKYASETKAGHQGVLNGKRKMGG